MQRQQSKRCDVFCNKTEVMETHSVVKKGLTLSFRSPSLFYLLTAGVEVVLFSLDHTQTHTTVGRTPLDEGSAVAETST
jgi:hypothetical protein